MGFAAFAPAFAAMAPYLGAASAVAGGALSLVQAGQQNKTAQANFDAQAQAAAQSQALSLVANNMENVQATDKMKTEAATRQQEAMRELGFIMAASGESGLAGGSNVRQLASVKANEEFDQDTIANNATNVFGQNAVENEADFISAKNARKNRPKINALQLGVSGLSGGLAGYSTYRGLKG